MTVIKEQYFKLCSPTVPRDLHMLCNKSQVANKPKTSLANGDRVEVKENQAVAAEGKLLGPSFMQYTFLLIIEMKMGP